MFKSDRVLALDIGTSKLVLAEFCTSRLGAPELVNYGIGHLGVESDSETDPSAYVVSTIRDVLREYDMKMAPLLMTISGHAVFPRYVKLPPVSPDKIQQMVRYEAEQNVPFPINEVVWDYQLIGDSGSGELNVMLVAVKTENISRLTDCVQAAGLEPAVVGVGPMALYNTVCYNYPDRQGCTMVLDIGARSSNLVFVEENRIFSRSIPVAGNAITQEIMKEFDLSFKEAEELKLAHAFVALGGVYAGPESEVTDRVSKIVRNVITRLHAEVNRSINFYRSQQGGTAPAKVLLTGGSSIIPHTNTFFREKLKVEVEYLNPFMNVTVSDRISAERIGKDMHLLGEVAGIALASSLTCPVEINLMPPDLLSTKTFRRRLPFLALSLAGVMLIMLCWWGYSFRMASLRNQHVERVKKRISDLEEIQRKMTGVIVGKEKMSARAMGLVRVINERSRWQEMIADIHANMLDGMWIKALNPVSTNGAVVGIELKGSAFNDKMKSHEGAQRTPVEEFRDKLRESPFFAEGSSILSQSKEQYMWEFAINLALETPIPARAVAPRAEGRPEDGAKQ